MIWKSTTVTHVAMIVDCSGSMMGRSADLWNAAVDVLRSCKHDGDIVLHPIWFANRIRADKPIHLNDAPRMTDHMILNMPIGGMTALVDGMLTAWEQMRGYECRAGNVAMLGLVLTDGKDNASKRSVSELAPIMERTQASGQWTWCYMGTRYDGRAKDLPWLPANRFTGRDMRAVKRTANKGLKAYMKARYEGLQSIDDMVTRS